MRHVLTNVCAGAEALRVEFDRRCSTERRHDPLTMMDCAGRTVSVRSGREWSDWSAELRMQGKQYSKYSSLNIKTLYYFIDAFFQLTFVYSLCHLCSFFVFFSLSFVLSF